MADKLNRISCQNIAFFGRFGEILVLRLVETFKNCLNS
jgi:hypothetical protein